MVEATSSREPLPAAGGASPGQRVGRNTDGPTTAERHSFSLALKGTARTGACPPPLGGHSALGRGLLRPYVNANWMQRVLTQPLQGVLNVG